MNNQQFVIHGKERRVLKGKLSQLKRSVKMFWHWEDISSAYGGGMSSKEANTYLTKTKKEISAIENKLNERYLMQ